MKTPKIIREFALLLAVCCCVTPVAKAQTGLPPFGTFQHGGFDTTNLLNLNTYFNIPIMSSPGRGLGVSYGMTYNSAFWVLTDNVWTVPTDSSGNPIFGWTLSGSMANMLGGVTYEDTLLTACSDYHKYSSFEYVDANGTYHPFLLSVYSSSTCGPTSASGYAADNSGFFLSAVFVSGTVNTTVTYPSGNGQSGTQLMDANGNYVTKTVSGTETDFTDTVGRTALKINAGSGSTTVKWYDPTGGYQTTTVVYSSFNIKTNFGCSSVEYSGTANLPTEIDLPNGNKYQFTYEATPGYSGYTTGRIQKVILPAGGYYQYDYSGTTDGTDCVGGALTSFTRTVNDGTNSTQWTYDRSGGPTVVSAPPMPYSSASNQSTYTSTEQKFYQGSVSGGTLLRTVDTTWASNGTPATQITTLNDTSQKSEVATTYDSNGNLTQAKEYDWGSGAVGSLLRETDFTYRSSLPFLQTQKLIKDGSGNVKFREDLAYDGGTLTSVTGITQHDDTHFGSSYTTRGNLTSMTSYTDPVTPGGALTRNFTYNTLGNLLTTSLGTVQQQQYVYSPTTTYAAPDSFTSGPTSGPQLTTSYTYNSYTGLLASTTDPNSQTTSYSYDVYKRATATTLPDSTQLTTSYNDSTFTVTSTTPIDSTPHKKVSVAAFDGLGRPVTTTLEDYSSTVHSISQTQYDPLGRAYKTSNPYISSPSYWTTSEFDALGRAIATILPDGSQNVASYSGNVVTSTDPAGKQRKSTFDAPGRLIEVDEPSGTATLAAGSGSGTVSGSEQYHAAAGATAGHGQVSIGGSEQSADEGDYEWVCTLWSCDGACEHQELEWVSNWVYDTGTVTITVNGHNDSASYNSGSSAASVASTLASAINGDSSASVTASVSGSVVLNLTAKTTGATTDYALSSSSVTTGDPYAFFSPSFYGSPSGNILTGGGPATSSSYDTGTVSITVDGNTISVSYGTSSTASSIASALISAVNSASSLPVTASGSGAGITLTANTSGAATNYSISSASSTSQPTLFSSPSFSIPSFGPTLTGGTGPDAWSTSVSTTYTYDVLNDLTTVTQGSQTRTYTYDGLGRNTSASIPETTSGGTQHTSYSNYDSDSSCSTPNSFPGVLVSAVDARGVRTCMQYDTLNRITGINYNVGSTGVTATSSVANTYGTSSSSHNNGRLVSMSDGTGSESYTYDIFGRITELDKVIGSTTYSTEYAYNLASELTQATYPSGRIVKQTYDAIGRLCGVGASGSTCSSGTTFASAYSFNAAGEVTGFTYGNGVVTNRSYSPDRMQLHCLQYDTTSVSDPCTKDSSALFMLTYQYGSAGANNGQISAITDGMDNGRTANYVYDGLGRLSTAATVGSTGYPAWGFSWTYDRYGNRTAQSILSGCTGGVTCLTDSLTVGASTNQITNTGFTYDANGNMTNDGYNALTYDAASRLISSSNGTSSGAYSYDGGGIRVKKATPISSPTSTTVYIFSGGKVIAEYDNGTAVGSPSREYIYSGGALIAKIAAGTTTYYHQDHLSNRLITNGTGGAIEQLGQFPFGENWYDTGTEKWKFITYERDGESSNDYAMARFDVNRLGRFSSPDPLSGGQGNPQSLNHYIYAGNDPINAIDPSGLEPCDPASYSPQNQMPAFCSSAIEEDGGGTGCTLDGITTACGIMGFGGGDAVACPNNACEGYNGNSQWVYFVATETGGAYYNSNYGPGAMFYSANAAGIAAVENINQASIDNNWEYSGNVYIDSNGFYSYTAPMTWQKEASSPFRPDLIPSGTTEVANYHTHGADIPGYFSEYFSWPTNRPNSVYPQLPQGGSGDIGLADRNSLPDYLGTPNGRVEIYNPSFGGNLPFGCVLVGNAVPNGIPTGTYTNMPGVPLCH